MGNFNVIQRTKDSFFNATELINGWNKYSGQKKNINHFLDNSSTNDFIEALIDELNIRNHEKPINQIVKRTKALTDKKGNRKAGCVWMTPMLFIKFAMWLNPHFEVKVIKFVHDNLIAFRHNAGDNYLGLTNAVSKFKDVNYSQLAKGLNYIIFDRHEKGIRQTATEKELDNLRELEKKLAFAVDMGYIRTFDELLNEMRKMYHRKKK
jgi:hypothetical protein